MAPAHTFRFIHMPHTKLEEFRLRIASGIPGPQYITPLVELAHSHVDGTTRLQIVGLSCVVGIWQYSGYTVRLANQF